MKYLIFDNALNLNKLNFSSKKDMKEGIIKYYNKYKPIIIYTETKRLPWEKGQKILRLNRHTMEQFEIQAAWPYLKWSGMGNDINHGDGEFDTI